ncbi:unnamed protein product [Adineta ricciae]|uniref:Transposase n=1 Tax=Adineta ricciae TaxID=249248 RepID=A0A816FNP0_ADIRI|nr:unnamed protein product [Adineta ricciae]CAF1663891.1 unnamed protein product [Adineta ricciae]
MSGHLSVGDRWRIVSLYYDEGNNVHEIANLVGCAIRTVYRILELFEETHNITERNGRGRHMALNNDEIYTLRQILYRYPNETSSNIVNRFLRRTGQLVPARTIRRYRQMLGFRPVHARTQAFITTIHAQQRLDFCLSYATNQWRNIIFSDEKAFVVDVSGVVYYIPRGRQRPIHFQSQVRYRVAIFGAVWYNGRSNLIFINDRTNTTTYVEYLQEALNGHLHRLRHYHFVHDRPRWAHTTLAHDWLESNHIRCMDDFPSVSPDLNAVESVSSWLNKYVQSRHPNSQRHLERLVQRAWNAIPQVVIRGYIRHIPDICNQIIANNGWQSIG